METAGTMVGATSPVIGALIMEAVVCRAAELADEAGCRPEIFASANTENGDEKNAGLIEKYKPLVKAM